MGQYGAAQPLIDAVRNKFDPSRWAERLGASKKTSAQPRQDTSWHDEQVRKATASFFTKSPSSRTTTTKKPTPKISSARKPVRKSSR